MKKRILSAVLAFCVLLALCPAPARAAKIVASGGCGAENAEDLIWTLDENGLLTFIGSGAMKDYEAQKSDYSVYTTNGYSFSYYTNAPWYQYRSQIKSVEIPSGVTRVGANAFGSIITTTGASGFRFDQLTSVTLADSVESIGDSAFRGCIALTGATLSNSLISIDANAFRSCSALTDIALKENVVSIGANAFNGCSALETLTIPNGVSEIGSGAFSNCSKLTVSVYNDSYAWRYVLSHNVRHMILGNETVYVASGSCGAENLTDLLWRVDGDGAMTFIGSGAMKDYEAQKSDYSVYTTNGYSFSYYTNAPWYQYRSQIKSVEIPSGVTRVGANAFGSIITTTGASSFRFDQLTSVTLADSVESIGDSAFRDCIALTGATLSNALASIDANAFRSCAALTDIALKENVVSIGANAFNGCSALETLTIPGSVTEIGENAFSNCPNFTATVYEGSYGRRYCLLNSVPHNAIDPNTYTITFHPNLGDGEPTTKTLTSIDTVYGEMPTPTRDGYAFMGWHTATEGGEQITPETKFEPRRNQTLYAVWSKMYALTFDPNGGEVSPTTKTLTDKDTVYGELPTPARDGYTFEGWHTAANGGTLVTADTEFADKRNQTLYAVWKEIKATYEVTLEANGGTVEPSSVTVEEGGAYGALPEPSRDGCAFLGWHTEPSAGTQVKAETPVRLTANQTLYAHWTATNAPEFSSNGAAVTDVREMSSETELEGKFTVPDAENPDAFRTATAFCVLYDKDGMMVHLQSWDVDVSDVRNIRFTGSVRIPEGAQVSEIKVIVLSDELVPLQAAGTL